MNWRESWDLSTIPDALLKSEWARRNNLKRETHGAGTGRPKEIRPCPYCGKKMGAREWRAHKPTCPKREEA